MVAGERGFVYEWPLWGLRLSDSGPGVAHAQWVDDARLYQPTWAEWSQVEDPAIVSEAAWGRDREHVRDRPDVPPPLAVLLRESEVDLGGEPVPDRDHQTAARRAFVAGLRLYSAGGFSDPEETGTYTTYPSGTVTRDVRAHRTAFYDEAFAAPYELARDDLANLVPFVRWSGVVLADVQHANAALAIESFCLSFGTSMTPAERGLHRFIALESLLGPVRRPASGPFHARACAAASVVADAEKWLGGCVDLRNDLAHRLHSCTPDVEDLSTLEDITRAVLVAYLAVIARQPSRHPLAGFIAALDRSDIEELP